MCKDNSKYIKYGIFVLAQTSRRIYCEMCKLAHIPECCSANKKAHPRDTSPSLSTTPSAANCLSISSWPHAPIPKHLLEKLPHGSGSCPISESGELQRPDQGAQTGYSLSRTTLHHASLNLSKDLMSMLVPVNPFSPSPSPLQFISLSQSLKRI